MSIRIDKEKLRKALEIPTIAPTFISESMYIIYKDGDVVKALNGKTGQVDFSDADASTVINQAIGALPPEGGVVFIREGIYNITSPIDLSLKKTSFSQVFHHSTVTYRRLQVQYSNLPHLWTT
jgi:hypothetical protein